MLFFYPKDDTPGCTTENMDFSALAGEFDKAGRRAARREQGSAGQAREVHRQARPDRAAGHATRTNGGLSDALGIWTEKQNYGRKYMGMERTTYLVDADGRIARVWRKVKVKGHADEVLEAAQGALTGRA